MGPLPTGLLPRIAAPLSLKLAAPICTSCPWQGGQSQASRGPQSFSQASSPEWAWPLHCPSTLGHRDTGRWHGRSPHPPGGVEEGKRRGNSCAQAVA